VHRLAKKIQAGADFIQTQCIYNMPRMREWTKQAVDMGLTDKVSILAGVTPMKSVGMAKYMQTKVPGMDVPEQIVKRLRGVEKKRQKNEGIKIAVEQIQEFKEMEGSAGVHLMAIEWEHRVPEIAELAGVLPRPEV
jgi:methylenetetrahydrofolate reductase (NADPH)